MADIIDDANARAEHDLQRAIAAARGNFDEAVITATGYCHNCGEVVDGLARWCDGDCRDDWKRRQSRRK